MLLRTINHSGDEILFKLFSEIDFTFTIIIIPNNNHLILVLKLSNHQPKSYSTNDTSDTREIIYRKSIVIHLSPPYNQS